MSDKEIEQQIQAKGLNAPRVTLAALEANIASTEIVKHISASGQVLRWAVLTTQSGFAVTGRPSVSASSENDCQSIGERVAIDNARYELWPLMGYALKQKLAEELAPHPLAGEISHLPPHQQRVLIERAELDDKLGKLNGFIGTDLFKTLPSDEQERLTVQRGAMTEYHQVLADRIGAFVPTT